MTRKVLKRALLEKFNKRVILGDLEIISVLAGIECLVGAKGGIIDV